jgi:hypothetical protein
METKKDPKKHPARIQLKALLEMFAQNRFAMWQAIDNESPDKCDRCAVKVCPWYIEEEEKIIDEIINLFLERFTLGMIANQKKVVEILQDKGEENNGKH